MRVAYVVERVLEFESMDPVVKTPCLNWAKNEEKEGKALVDEEWAWLVSHTQHTFLSHVALT